jgi:GNAT superfamily N-acetyltransferase
MSDHPLSPISRADSGRACETLTSAFATDHRDYATNFPLFVAALGDSSMETSTAWQLDDYGAVAMWLPPGTEPDAERIGRVLIETVAPERHSEMFAILEQMDEAHPRYAHWYLPWLGVHAEKQGRGLGTTLLAASLEYVDLGGLPAYLETPNPRSIALYERHGFVVTGHTESANCPPLTFMRREGRRR